MSIHEVRTAVPPGLENYRSQVVEVAGGRELKGTITKEKVGGAKNSRYKLMIASCLFDSRTL